MQFEHGIFRTRFTVLKRATRLLGFAWNSEKASRSSRIRSNATSLILYSMKLADSSRTTFIHRHKMGGRIAQAVASKDHDVRHEGVGALAGVLSWHSKHANRGQ